MSKREGLNNVSYDVTLTCLHVVTYKVPPSAKDFLTCVRCSKGSAVLTIRRKKDLRQSA